MFGSMSMFPAAFVRAHIRSSVWRPAQIGYLSMPSKTSVTNRGRAQVAPPSVERVTRYWVRSVLSTLKFWKAT